MAWIIHEHQSLGNFTTPSQAPSTILRWLVWVVGHPTTDVKFEEYHCFPIGSVYRTSFIRIISFLSIWSLAQVSRKLWEFATWLLKDGESNLVLHLFSLSALCRERAIC